MVRQIFPMSSRTRELVSKQASKQASEQASELAVRSIERASDRANGSVFAAQYYAVQDLLGEESECTAPEKKFRITQAA